MKRRERGLTGFGHYQAELGNERGRELCLGMNRGQSKDALETLVKLRDELDTLGGQPFKRVFGAGLQVQEIA